MAPSNQDFESFYTDTRNLGWRILEQAIDTQWEDEKNQKAYFEWVRRRGDKAWAQQENSVPAEEIFTHIWDMDFT